MPLVKSRPLTPDNVSLLETRRMSQRKSLRRNSMSLSMKRRVVIATVVSLHVVVEAVIRSTTA